MPHLHPTRTDHRVCETRCAAVLAPPASQEVRLETNRFRAVLPRAVTGPLGVMVQLGFNLRDAMGLQPVVAVLRNPNREPSTSGIAPGSVDRPRRRPGADPMPRVLYLASILRPEQVFRTGSLPPGASLSIPGYLASKGCQECFRWSIVNSNVSIAIEQCTKAQQGLCRPANEPVVPRAVGWYQSTWSGGVCVRD
jgi:hypothetical protein